MSSRMSSTIGSEDDLFRGFDYDLMSKSLTAKSTDLTKRPPFYSGPSKSKSCQDSKRLSRIQQAKMLYMTPKNRNRYGGSVDDLLKATKPDVMPPNQYLHKRHASMSDLTYKKTNISKTKSMDNLTNRQQYDSANYRITESVVKPKRDRINSEESSLKPRTAPILNKRKQNERTASASSLSRESQQPQKKMDKSTKSEENLIEQSVKQVKQMSKSHPSEDKNPFFLTGDPQEEIFHPITPDTTDLVPPNEVAENLLNVEDERNGNGNGTPVEENIYSEVVKEQNVQPTRDILNENTSGLTKNLLEKWNHMHIENENDTKSIKRKKSRSEVDEVTEEAEESISVTISTKLLKELFLNQEFSQSEATYRKINPLVDKRIKFLIIPFCTEITNNKISILH